jgi:LCP family protein required for cell wall assembly
MTTEKPTVVSQLSGQRLEPGQFGPLLRGGRDRGSRWPRVAIVALSAVVTLALVVGAVGAALMIYGERSIKKTDVDGVVGSAPFGGDGEWAGVDIRAIADVRNILVVGNDSREGLSEDQLLRLGTEPADGDRTDTVMLVQLDPGREQAAVLSFPRDLLVTRCDGSRGRINGAYGIGEQDGTGGSSCLVQTVTDFTGIPIHHYVEVNFAGFVDVVDTLGGVTMYLEEPLQDGHAGLDLPAGCVTLDGIDALSFVRARRLDPTGDFGRMARQQRFIRELMDEVTKVGVLLNVPKLFVLVEALGRTVETDRDLSLREMRRIAFSLRNVTPDGIDVRTVPAVPRTIDDADYVVAKEEEAETLFQSFRDGTVFPEGVGLDGPTEVSVGDVPPLVILNGSGVPGLAARAAEALTAYGFEVEETGNADSFDFEATQVVFPEDRREEAAVIAVAIPGAVLVPGDQENGFVVVVGSEFDAADVAAPPETTEVSPAAEPAPDPAADFRGAQPADVEC